MLKVTARALFKTQLSHIQLHSEPLRNFSNFIRLHEHNVTQLSHITKSDQYIIASGLSERVSKRNKETQRVGFKTMSAISLYSYIHTLLLKKQGDFMRMLFILHSITRRSLSFSFLYSVY